MTDGFLEEIKSRIDIVDLLSDYMQLKKAGQNWKGLCPFHAEKTPSFMVNPSRQTFHCFGCGKGGDIIAFLMMHENLPFPEAVGLLADRAGVKVPQKTGGRNIGKDKRLGEALQDAQRFFSDRLQDSQRAAEYIQKRGIGRESVELFGLGFAPQGWQNLLRFLRERGHSDATVRAAGLAVAGDKGLYDMFRDRIMFPIKGLSGNVVAFGGRAFGDALPKYINSPETPLFRKSETLFGLFTAKDEIRKTDSVMVVEGYTDVIICFQYGFRNAVAPLGTALTAGHIKRLRALAGRAVLVFDGDRPGRAAARRTFPLICRGAYKAEVLLLPDEEDPDSFLRKHGAAAFESLLNKKRSLVDFIVSESGGGIESVKEVLSLAAECNDRLMAEEMLVELSDRTRISEKAIREEFGRMRNRGSSDSRTAAVPERPAGTHGEEYRLLSAVIACPEKADYVLSNLDIEDIRDKTVSALFRRMSAMGNNKDLASIIDEVGEEERRIITKFSVDPGFDLDHVDQNIGDCIRRIRQRKLDERLRRSDDAELANTLLNEKKKILKGADL